MSDSADAAPSAPSNAASSSGPASTRHCSECGWGTPSHKPHTPLWPKLILWLVPPIIAIGFVIAASRSISTYSFGPEYLGVMLTQPIVTRGDLREIAAGEAVVRADTPINLASAFDAYKRPSYGFGEVRYQAMLIAPLPGREMRFQTLGWPFSWLRRTTTSYFTDAPNRVGPRMAVSTTPNRTHRESLDKVNVRAAGYSLTARDIVWHLAPERTGGKQVDVQISFAPLVACLVVAFCAAVLVRVLLKSPSRHRSAGRTRNRNGRRWVGVALILIILTIGLGFHRSFTRVFPDIKRNSSPGRITGIHTSLDPSAALTTLSAGDLRSFSDRDLTNQRLAANILMVCGDTPDSALNDVLLAAACIENWNVNCHMLEVSSFLSIFSLARLNHERCPDFGPQEPVTKPRSISIELDFHFLRFTRASGRPNEPVPELCIFLPGLLAALTLILAPGLIPFLLHRQFTRRRAAKRERKSLCPSCAYPFTALTHVPSAAAPTNPPALPPLS